MQDILYDADDLAVCLKMNADEVACYPGVARCESVVAARQSQACLCKAD